MKPRSLSLPMNNNTAMDGGWHYPWWFFSTARYNPGGPTWYDKDMSHPAILYMERSIMGILTTGLTLLFMFLVILPIIKYRLHSAITALHVLGTGFTISMCMVTPDWLTGSSVIHSVMNHYTPTVYAMRVGVHIGLSSYNVTLQYLSTISSSVSSGNPNVTAVVPGSSLSGTSTGNFWYNERVMTSHPEDLEFAMVNSLRRGMPTPLLTVIHFLSSSTMGFEWPHRVGEAGFHVFIILLFALIAWIVAAILVASIPRYSSYAFIAVGGMMIGAALIYFYWAMIDLVFPCIVVEDQFIEISYGPCFWACLGVGVWSTIYGFTLAVFDLTHPDKFLTIFDFDYDNKRTLARANRLNQFPEVLENARNLQYCD